MWSEFCYVIVAWQNVTTCWDFFRLLSIMDWNMQTCISNITVPAIPKLCNNKTISCTKMLNNKNFFIVNKTNRVQRQLKDDCYIIIDNKMLHNAHELQPHLERCSMHIGCNEFVMGDCMRFTTLSVSAKICTYYVVVK